MRKTDYGIVLLEGEDRVEGPASCGHRIDVMVWPFLRDGEDAVPKSTVLDRIRDEVRCVECWQGERRPD